MRGEQQARRRLGEARAGACKQQAGAEHRAREAQAQACRRAFRALFARVLDERA